MNDGKSHCSYSSFAEDRVHSSLSSLPKGLPRVRLRQYFESCLWSYLTCSVERPEEMKDKKLTMEPVAGVRELSPTGRCGRCRVGVE